MSEAAPGVTAPVAVSVLTPVFNEAESLAPVLEEMRAQLDPGGAIEYLFIDGRSTDGTRALIDAAAREDSRIRVLDNPRRRTNVSLNIGLAAARGRYVARMDAHTHYPRHYLRAAVRRIELGDVASVSGPQLAVGEDPWSRRVAVALGTRLGIGGASFRRELDHEIDVPSGFTGLWKAETLRDVGGWDDRAHPNGDAELAARIRARGGRIVCVPELAASYVPRNSFRGLRTQYWRYGTGRARTTLLHPETAQIAHLAPPAVILALLGLLAPVRRLRQTSRGAVAAYVAGLAVTALGERRHHGAEACHLPLVLSTMHLSWGAGFLVGLVKHGIRRDAPVEAPDAR